MGEGHHKEVTLTPDSHAAASSLGGRAKGGLPTDTSRIPDACPFSLWGWRKLVSLSLCVFSLGHPRAVVPTLAP